MPEKWPKVTAAITAKHPWLVIACDSCGTVVDLDLRVKPRDPEASVPVALRDVRCPRCNGHGRPHHGVIAASVALRVVGGRWQVRINAHPLYARPTSPVLAAMMFG